MRRHPRGHAVLVGALALVAALAGCGDQLSVSPERVVRDSHASGADQAGLHGQELPLPLRVIVQGPRRPGLLGGKGGYPPASGVPVTFALRDVAAGAVFADNGASTLTVKTDAGGMAAARLRLGRYSGDVMVDASAETSTGVKTIPFRVLSGVEILGRDLEVGTGGRIDAVGVRIQNADGSPAQGVSVSFQPEGDAGKSLIHNELVVTGPDGVATTSWTLGKRIGRYFASAQIQDLEPTNPAVPHIRARACTLEADRAK